MTDDLDRFIDGLRFDEDGKDPGAKPGKLKDGAGMHALVKEVLARASESIDAETGLNSIIDVLQERLAPEACLVLAGNGDIRLERDTKSLFQGFSGRVQGDGDLDWLRETKEQTVRVLEGRALVITPVPSQSETPGFLVAAFRDAPVPTHVLEGLTVTAHVLSLVSSKEEISAELTEKTDALEVRVAEIQELYDELATVHEFVKEAGSIFEEQELFARLLEICVRAFRVNEGLVLRPDGDAASLQAVAAWPEGMAGHRFEASEFGDAFWVTGRVVNSRHGCPACLQRDRRWEAVLSAPIALDKTVSALVVLSERDTNKPFSRQDERVLLSLARQAGNCLQSIRLHQELLEKKALERDLELAGDIQQSLLPDAPPRIEGLDIAAFFSPAARVGGDYFDYYQIDAHRCWFFIGDVSGKGMAAALLMAGLRSMLRAEAPKAAEDAGRLLTNLNALLCPDIYAGKFVTFLAGCIDARRQSLHFSNAGHLPLLLLKSGSDRVESYGAMDMPLGISGEVVYPSESLTFSQGDVLLVSTDGISEARNSRGEEFGMDRLADVFRESRSEEAAAIIQNVLRAVDGFAGKEGQSDDRALLVIKGTGSAEPT